jgi:hypothetical protein
MLVAMTRILPLPALSGAVMLLCGIAPANAADTMAPAGQPVVWRYNTSNQTLPFPRGERAQSVWASGACRTDCGSHCTWGIAACLQYNAQGHCLKLGDACDRYCQRECRAMGGPLLPDILDAWE